MNHIRKTTPLVIRSLVTIAFTVLFLRYQQSSQISFKFLSNEQQGIIVTEAFFKEGNTSYSEDFSVKKTINIEPQRWHTISLSLPSRELSPRLRLDPTNRQAVFWIKELKLKEKGRLRPTSLVHALRESRSATMSSEESSVFEILPFNSDPQLHFHFDQPLNRNSNWPQTTMFLIGLVVLLLVLAMTKTDRKLANLLRTTGKVLIIPLKHPKALEAYISLTGGLLCCLPFLSRDQDYASGSVLLSFGFGTLVFSILTLISNKLRSFDDIS